MTVIVKHNKTNSITDWTQAQLDEQIALGNFPPGTTLANIVLPSDWNNDHTLTGVGTMAEQNATAVAITGGTIDNTTIGATTATTGRFTSVTTPSVTATTTDLTLSSLSTGSVYVNQGANGATGLVLSNSALATASARLFFQNSNGTTSIGNINGNTIEFKTNATINSTSGIDQFRVSHTASAVNYVQVTGAATGSASAGPAISTQGSSADAALILQKKGLGEIVLQGTARFGANQVNYISAAGAVTTTTPIFSAKGTDTNVSLAIQSQGTGAIDLAAGSSGVNISNGGTVTAITRTSVGSSYTTNPTVAISAPTTAGGVQATATVPIGVASFTVSNGGTGYAVGNVLTMVGGTFTSAGTCTVSAVSGGVITAVTATSTGTYTAAPTNPASVTGGAGTGATFTLNFGILSTFTITNAGSGYIEQPTITFSGGGGSGAAAYATVGSDPIVRSIGSALKFFTPNGETLRLLNSGGVNANYVGISGGASGSRALVRSEGSDTNIDLSLLSTGTGNINFATNGASANIQARVSHTASAVNYVQVTGATTTNRPRISFEGSDGNIGGLYLAKGTSGHSFCSDSNAGVVQFSISRTASAVNNLQATGSAAGSAPSFSAIGTDTDIDITLTPKGAGVVQFGTYTGTILTPTGYITIKDSGGTTRRLLVG